LSFDRSWVERTRDAARPAVFAPSNNGVTHVTELLKSLTDDQTAILGCMLAFAAATGLLSLSFHTNPQNKVSSESNEAETLPMAERQDETHRRAA